MRISHALVAGAATLLTTQCSLLAPSDQALMGGDKTSDGGDAGEAGASGDASGGMDTGPVPFEGGGQTEGGGSGEGGGNTEGGGNCLQEGDCCGGPGGCCAALVCEPNSGVCVPCVASGGGCFPADDLCCSGTCKGNHTCQ